MQYNNKGALHLSLHCTAWRQRRQSVTFLSLLSSNCSGTRSYFTGEREETREREEGEEEERDYRQASEASMVWNEASERKFYIVVAENDMTRKEGREEGGEEGIAIARRRSGRADGGRGRQRNAVHEGDMRESKLCLPRSPPARQCCENSTAINTKKSLTLSLT